MVSYCIMLIKGYENLFIHLFNKFICDVSGSLNHWRFRDGEIAELTSFVAHTVEKISQRVDLVPLVHQ